jgi:protein TonB
MVPILRDEPPPPFDHTPPVDTFWPDIAPVAQAHSRSQDPRPRRQSPPRDAVRSSSLDAPSSAPVAIAADADDVVADVALSDADWSGLPAGDSLPLGFFVGGGAVVGGGTAQQAGGEPQRVGGDIVPPAKVVHVTPVYPEIARTARVSGIVVVDCTIDPAGNVVDVRVLSGNPLLAPAAVEAVSRWTYTPSRLNGVPVSVLMTVTVRFDLKR